MKKIVNFSALVAVLLCGISCIDHSRDNYKYYTDTVTFRPTAEGGFYLHADDTTALVVLNEDLQKYPFEDGKERRASIFCYIDPEHEQQSRLEGYKYTYEVNLIMYDTLYTKAPVIYDAAHDADYGSDQISLFTDPNFYPFTNIEDGYLNLYFSISVAGFARHEINLLTGVNPEDPYEVEVRHNAHGDPLGYNQASVFVFPLKDLPSTGAEEKILTIKWKDFGTETRIYKIPFRSRLDW